MGTGGKSFVKGATAGKTGRAALDLTAERTRLARLQADRLAMENDLRRGDLVEVSAVRERWDAVAGIVKRRLLAISSKLAPRLLGLRSPAEVKTIIDSEVYAALEELSSGGVKPNRAKRRAKR